jgi:hypothetical protein
MRKLIGIILGLLLLTAAAFADLSIGLNGALYMDDGDLEAATGVSVAEQFRSGDGIYYGLMAEALGKKIGLGASYMASFYDSEITGNRMVNMDLNLALDAHLIGSRTILDPFVGVGLGYVYKDYADEDFDDDPDNPVSATAYWFLNGGLGLNLGPIGIFTKFLYHIPFGPIEGSEALDDVTLEAFALEPYKIVIGAKVIFPLFPRH